MLEWRFWRAYERWLTKKEPNWAMGTTLKSTFRTKTITMPRPKFHGRSKPSPGTDVDPQLLEDLQEAWVSPLKEQAILGGRRGCRKTWGVETSAMVACGPPCSILFVPSGDHLSGHELKNSGVIFSVRFSVKAIRRASELVKKYLFGSAVE